jgi:hypothetical protein
MGAILDWLARYRGPTLAVEALVRAPATAHGRNRLRSNIAKSHYHLLKLNDWLGQYHTADANSRQRLNIAIGRKVQFLRDLGLRLPDDRRQLQALVADLVGGHPEARM